MNLLRKFELQRMKDFQTVNEYSKEIAWHCQQIRLQGPNYKIQEFLKKILLTVLEGCLACITLENTHDLSKIILTQLLNTF